MELFREWWPKARELWDVNLRDSAALHPSPGLTGQLAQDVIGRVVQSAE